MSKEIYEKYLHNGATAVSDGDSVENDGGGWYAAAFQVEITGTATLTAEATLDNVSWYPVQVTNLSDGTASTTVSASGVYRLDANCLGWIRFRISSYTSGTVTVLARAQEV